VGHVSEDGPQPPADQALPAPHPHLISELAFPEVARLELDELLEQLVARARDVQDTQGRLRGLLRANLEVARGVDLEEVLRHVVDAACELVHARYAAIGVVRDGHLVRFVHTGMGGDDVARVGGLPEGKGVLGLLVERPQRLRLRDITEHVCSVGFPEHHPPMRSFLGVPVRVRDRVFGNLYLAGKQGADEFTAEDEELVAALAAAAGVALALELAEARRDYERLRLLEDRQRIGEDLQHSVIQRLFALGLSIQAMAVRVGDSEVKRLITDRVEEIDDIIRDIRATVFALRSPRLTRGPAGS
jgi:GAF domain-containing protein